MSSQLASLCCWMVEYSSQPHQECCASYLCDLYLDYSALALTLLLWLSTIEESSIARISFTRPLFIYLHKIRHRMHSRSEVRSLWAILGDFGGKKMTLIPCLPQWARESFDEWFLEYFEVKDTANGPKSPYSQFMGPNAFESQTHRQALECLKGF